MVLFSRSLARAGGPANSATSTGAACTATWTSSAWRKSVLSKKRLSPWQATDAAGRQPASSA